jgi:hypothetical protein
MATIVLNVPDPQLTRVVNALCALNGVPATGPNAKAVVVGWVTAMVLEQERIAAASTAVAALPGTDPGIS